jgi:hypothetical protein
VRALVWVVSLAMVAAGCGSASGTSGGATGPQSPFVGSWTCPYTTNSEFMDTTTMVFKLNADGTLSSTSSLQSSECDLRWSVSGTTATALGGQTCGDGGAGSFSITSYAFTVNGNQVMFSAAAVLHGLNQTADGGFTPIDLSGTLSGTCTRGGADGDAQADANSGGGQIASCDSSDGDPCAICDKAACCCYAAVGQSFCSAYSGAGCRAASASNQSYLIMQCGIEVGAAQATNACR